MDFLFDVNKQNDKLLVVLKGDLLNKSQANSLISGLDVEINKGEKEVLMDLSGMGYLNSTGLNVLINIYSQIKGNGSKLVLTNVPKKIKSLFLITKLDRVFTIKNNN